MYKHVVCPVGLERESYSALNRAVALKKMDGARLTLLHLDPDFLSGEEMQMLRTSTAKEHERMKERALRDRESIDAQLAALGFADEVDEIELREGNPEKDIASEAMKLGADLIVICSSGRNQLGERIVGSTAEHVLARSDVDVFVVRIRD